MAKPYHHGDLRAGLLDAAETLLDTEGIAALSLRAIARAAGVSHAAPKHHFRDLTGLLTALTTIGFERFRAALLAEVHPEMPPASRLRALGSAYLGFARAHPGLFQLMFRSERLDWTSPDLKHAASAAFAVLSDIDAPSGASAGPIPREGLVRALARWSFVHGVATLWLDGRVAAMAAKHQQPDPGGIVHDMLAWLP